MKPASQPWTTVLATVASLLLLGQAQSATTAGSTASEASRTSAALPSSFEIDVIYPLNDTYNATSTFPIVFAIQKPLLASQLRPFTFQWNIMPYGDGNSPGGISVGGTGEWIHQYSSADFTEDTFFLVNVTNALEWHNGVTYDGKVHALQWYLQWENALDICGHENDIFGEIFFSVDKEGRNPDIMDVQGQCPVLGSLVRINTNLTDKASCPGFPMKSSNGNPCNITIDSLRASRISTQIASLATPPPIVTTTAAVDKDSLASNLAVANPLLQAFALLAFLRCFYAYG